MQGVCKLKPSISKFTGKIALVTGGSQGIGLATAQQLLASGARVITCGRSSDKWAAALTQFPSLNDVDFQAVDLTQAAALKNWFADIRQRYGRLDIAVNNFATGNRGVGAFASLAEGDLTSALHATLRAPMACLQEEIALMLNNKSGAAIVNVSSVNGLRATPGAALYSAAKHGIEGISKSLALEYIAQGIRINSVAPGVTLTPSWEARLAAADSPGAMKAEVEAMVPLKRFATPEEIANAIVWLCSDASSYVVGHTLVIDGGLSQA
jgi:NAD(P)-dependent dehydrogenase (short-subunit alcohol dehydrogenase family)